MAASVIVSNLRVDDDKPEDIGDDLNRALEVVDGAFGLNIDGREVVFDDRPLFSLYLLKGGIVGALFAPSRPFHLRSFYSSDEVSFSTGIAGVMLGRIRVLGLEQEFEMSYADLCQSAGDSFRTVHRLLEDVAPVSLQTWPMYHIFDGII